MWGATRHTVTHDSLELDTGFIVHNEENYPSLTRLFRELGVATQPSEMSFAMSCGCGLEWSSRRPWRAGPRLLREILRFLRTAGSSGHGRQVVRPLPSRRAILRLVSLALPRADDLRALVDRSEEALDVSRPPTGSSSSATTRCSACVATAGEPSPAAAAPTSGRCSTGSARGSRSRRPCARCAARRTGVVLRDRRRHLAELRRRRRRDERAARARAARGLPRSRSARSSPPSRRRRTRPCCTRTRACCRGAARIAPRGTTDRPVAASTPTEPSLTYSLNRLQRLDATPEYCVTLNRTDEIDAGRRDPRASTTSTRSVTFASLAAAERARALRRRAAHGLRGGVAGQRLPRGRARLRVCGPRPRSECGEPGEERALRRHRHARAPLAARQRLPLPGLHGAASTSTSCRLLDRRLPPVRLEPARGHELPRRRPHRHPRDARRRTASSSATAARSRC